MIIIFLMLFVTGCSNEKFFICKNDLYNKIQDYNLEAIYKVYYEDYYVVKINKEEIYKSKNKDTLNYFNEYKKLEYKSLNDLYSGITYSIERNDNLVKLTSTIDMSLVDINEMVNNNYINKDYVVSNKLTISGLKSIYTEKGFSCDI